MSLWYRIGRQGAQGELLAAADLMDHGFEVFRAVDPVASTDLIAHNKGRYWRVQVKTGKPGVTEIREGRQEIVAWVDVPTRQVRYEPGLPHVVHAMPEPDFSESDTAVAGMIEVAAKRNHSEGHVAWYAKLHCENKPCGKPGDRYSCDVREIDFYVKEFPNDPPPVRGPFVCPACGKPAKLVSVRTGREQRQEDQRRARFWVNVQLEELRQLQKNPQTLIVHSSFDDETVPGWTDCESPLVQECP